MLERVYKTFSKPFGFENPSKELRESLKLLNWNIKGWEVISSSTWLMIISFIVISPIVAFLLLNSMYFTSILVSLFPIMVYYLLTEYPKYLAKVKISEIVGEIPIFMTQLVLVLKSNPNVESAIEFLSKNNGILYDELREGLWKVREGLFSNGKEVLINLSRKWGKFFPEFERGISILISSLNEKNREESLSRALDVCINGVKERTEDYSQSLIIPTMLLFSLSTVLPLVSITLLPLLSFLNFNFSLVFIILTISLVLSYFYSNQTIGKRPISFKSVKIKSRKKINVFWVVSMFLIISSPSILYLLNFIPGVKTYVFPEGFNLIWIIMGLGFSLSFYFYFISADKIKERDRIEKEETNASTIGYKLATIVGEGKPIDDELEKVRGDSKRIKLLKFLVSNLKEKGSRSLHELLMRFSDYFREIDKIHFSIFIKMKNMVDMMKLSAILFIPFVAGLSSAFALIMKKNLSKTIFSFNLNVEMVSFLSGLYMIFLLLILLRYVVYLVNGEDRIKFYYESSKSIPTALFIFILTFVIATKVIG